MLGCFTPNLGQIWTNPNVGLKMQVKKLQLKVKVLNYLKFLTQHLGLSIFDPTILKQPSIFYSVGISYG